MWVIQAAFYNLLLPLGIVGPVLSLNFLQSAIGYRLAGRILRRVRPPRLLAAQEVYSRTLDVVASAFPTPASPFLMAAAGASMARAR